MARKNLIAVLMVSTCLTVAAPIPAHAAMAVFDGTLVGKAIEQIREIKAQIAVEFEQLAELKKQLDFLTEISGFMNDVQKAIGELTHISLPIPNILQMQAQIKSDMRCLMPGGDLWGITFTDLNLGSICDTSAKYRDSLFVGDKALRGQAFSKTEAAWRQVEKRREALLEDTVVRSLAQADVQQNQADKISDAADDLQKSLNSAKDVQERLHVTAQAQILQARALAQQNQMIAQQLRLQAAAEVKKGMRPEQVKAVLDNEEEK